MLAGNHDEGVVDGVRHLANGRVGLYAQDFRGRRIDGVDGPCIAMLLHKAQRPGRVLFWIAGCAYKRNRRSDERRVGKSVSVRLDLGGRRIIKKKKKKYNNRLQDQ